MDKEVRTAASKFLRLAYGEARRQQLIPKHDAHGYHGNSRGPWPLSWPVREIAQSDISAPLVTALRKAYPARFGTESKFPFRDPHLYVAALLRASIAESVLRDDPLSPRSPASLSMLEEFHRVVSLDGQRFCSLWSISDVDFRYVNRAEVAGVTLVHASPPRDLEVSHRIPEGLWVGDGFSGIFTGLLYGWGEGLEHHWDVTKAINGRIGRLLAALRLGTAGTIQERTSWMGETSMIHVEMPEAHPQGGDGFGESIWRRKASITTDQLPGLEKLAALLDRLEPKDSNTTRAAVTVAIGRYTRSFRGADWRDNLLDLSTALEACLTPPKEEIGLTLRTRAAHLLAHDDSEQAASIYDDIDDLYNLRSDIVHGNPKPRKELAKLWEERGYDQLFERDKVHLLLDRWRDIVRRAIAARLLLGDSLLGAPLWPFVPVGGKQIKVDRFLVRADSRAEWRERIVTGAAAYGLPLLADPAAPLIDYLNAPEDHHIY